MIAAAPLAQRWNRATLEAQRGWRLQVPAAVAAEVASACRRQPALRQNVLAVDGSLDELPGLRALADEVRQKLLLGPGVVWLRGLALSLPAEEQRVFMAAFGAALGTPLDHYGRLYEVRDRGVSYRTDAVPVSMTKACTGFHTDSSRIDCLPDFVGLLCERPAKEGGESLVSNALQAHATLQEQAPDALAVLAQPLVRDLVTPGVERTAAALAANRFPVFARSTRPEGLLFRYMRYWIERGQERAGEPLGARALAALDALDEHLADDAHVARFRLAAGDMMWVNNRFLAHNRDAYEDDPACPRLLHRMWVCAER